MSSVAKELLARFRAGSSPPSWAFYMLVLLCLVAIAVVGSPAIDSTIYALLGLLGDGLHAPSGFRLTESRR